MQVYIVIVIDNNTVKECYVFEKLSEASDIYKELLDLGFNCSLISKHVK
jgi:hypothetical protein